MERRDGGLTICLSGQLPKATGGLHRDPFPIDKLQLDLAALEDLRGSKGFDEGKPTMFPLNYRVQQSMLT